MSPSASRYASLDRHQVFQFLRQTLEAPFQMGFSAKLPFIAVGQMVLLASIVATVEPPFALAAAVYVASSALGALLTLGWSRRKQRAQAYADAFAERFGAFLEGSMSMDGYLEHLRVEYQGRAPALLPIFEQLEHRLKYAADRDRAAALVAALRQAA